MDDAFVRFQQEYAWGPLLLCLFILIGLSALAAFVRLWTGRKDLHVWPFD